MEKIQKTKIFLLKVLKLICKKNEKENKNNSYQKNRIQILIHEKTFTKTNLIKKHNIKNKIVTNLHSNILDKTYKNKEIKKFKKKNKNNNNLF